jgi:hypothetical protein
MLIPFGILSSAAGVEVGDYELIASEILTTSESSITFSNLGDYSSTYKHLQLRYTGRTTTNPLGGTFEQLRIRFNGDTGSNYAFHFMLGSQSGAVESVAATSQTGIAQIILVSSGGGTNVFSSGFVDILDPFSSSKNTTVRSLNGKVESGAAQIRLTSGAYFNTAAVSSLDLTPTNGSFETGSRFSLYGIR